MIISERIESLESYCGRDYPENGKRENKKRENYIVVCLF
jgi:hypothetical protein